MIENKQKPSITPTKKQSPARVNGLRKTIKNSGLKKVKMLGLDIMEPSMQEVVDKANYQLSRAIAIVALSLGISTIEVCMALRIDYDYHDSDNGYLRIDTTQLPHLKAKK